MARTRRRIGGALAVFLLLASAPARGDMGPIEPEGTRAVPTAVELDWGPLATSLLQRYVVRPGDTLRSIARGLSPAPAAWKRLAALNEAVLPNPDRLRAGDAIWVPTTAAAFDAPAAQRPVSSTYVLVWVRPGHREAREYLTLADPSKDLAQVMGPFGLTLLPTPAAMVLLRTPQGDPRPLGTTAATPGVLNALLGAGLDRVPTAAPVVRRSLQVVVRGLEGGRLVTEERLIAYDAAGQVLTNPTSGPEVAPAPLPRRPAPAEADGGIPVARVAQAAPEAYARPEGAPEEGETRWPLGMGLLVAGLGLALIAVLWALRQPPIARA